MADLVAGLDGLIQKELVFGKPHKERVPPGQTVAFGGIEGGIHGHRVPELLIRSMYSTSCILLPQLTVSLLRLKNPARRGKEPYWLAAP